jgi:hypothetical protein
MKSPSKFKPDFEIEKKDTPLNQEQNFAFLPELWERPVSLFESANSVTPMAELRLIDLLRCLGEDLWENFCSPEILSLMQIAKVTAGQILNEIDKSRLQNLKRVMPAFTPHGSLNTRASDTLDKSFLASGWVQIDVDGKDNPSFSPIELKERISTWPFVGYCGYSVSGKGVWALAPTTLPLAATSTYIYHFAQKEGVTIDSSKGKADTELRFISFDPDPYFNYNPSFIMPHQVESSSIPRVKKTYHPVSSTSKDGVIKTLLELLNAAPEGSRHDQRLKVGRLAGGYVAGGLFSEHEIITILSDDYTMHFPFDSPTTQKKEIKALEDGIQYGLGSPISLVEEAFAIPIDGLAFIRESEIEITQGEAIYLIDSEAVLERKPDLLYIKSSTYFDLDPRPRRHKHLTKKICPP